MSEQPKESPRGIDLACAGGVVWIFKKAKSFQDAVIFTGNAADELQSASSESRPAAS